MTLDDILASRLSNQQFINTKFKTASQLVSWFGAVQSQDFQGAKWALGQRLGLSDKQVEQEFNEGKILRTHIMRPTWHFVSPSDIVWMQKLTSPRVNRIMNYYNKILGLDRKLFDKTNKIITKALSGNKYLTRSEIAKVLEENGLSLKGQKLGHVVTQAELDAVICSGPRVGKQFTYALVKERTAGSKRINPANHLAELAKRFFHSHGPATVRDFVWWSGLTTAEARKGIGESKFNSEIVGGKTYWSITKPNSKLSIPNSLLLLPNYDEYTIAYQDRDAFLEPKVVEYFKKQGNAAFWNAIVYRGKIIGMWKRTFKPKSIVLETQFFEKLKGEEDKKFKEMIGKLGKFFNTKVVLVNT